MSAALPLAAPSVPPAAAHSATAALAVASPAVSASFGFFTTKKPGAFFCVAFAPASLPAFAARTCAALPSCLGAAFCCSSKRALSSLSRWRLALVSALRVACSCSMSTKCAAKFMRVRASPSLACFSWSFARPNFSSSFVDQVCEFDDPILLMSSAAVPVCSSFLWPSYAPRFPPAASALPAALAAISKASTLHAACASRAAHASSQRP
mmetsp:Transcript_43314/g.119794  ORF Transcript_43314/g.119794 Transcript_43314/m.119794 type:complete len:209 (+) Transcript_43314:509-1135(+)